MTLVKFLQSNHSSVKCKFANSLFLIVCCHIVSSMAQVEADLNLAPDVSEDFPVIFNIILFLSISLILSLVAISVVIATMDPGRDSVIYRVTSSQRYKKDN